MGKSRPGPRVRMTIDGPMSPAVAFFLVSTLAGCAHRDVVDTPVGWFHQLQGGAIAQQRPPPPGANDPYPKIGTTPPHAPAVASLDLRHSVTGALLRQRNLTTRLDANDPIPPPVTLPAAAAKPAPPPLAPAGGSSAMLDAAEAPAGAAASGSAKTASASPDTDSAPELALPAVVVQAADPSSTPDVLPAIPGAPPASPRLRGLAVLAATPVTEQLPDYRTAPVTGTQVAFYPGTDSMVSGQSGALHAVAVQRGLGSMRVVGYGDAAAPDPDTQAQALSLAALRARTVAQALQAEGVPAKAIVLRAEAFGRGASVSLVP